MASASRDKNGNAIVQFIGADKRRRSIRLGKISDARVEIIRQRVELLRVAGQHGHALDGEVMSWLAKMSDDMHEKFAVVGLVDRRKSALLGAFVDAYVDARTDAAPRTILNLKQAAKRLKDHFGADKPMRNITPADADAFAFALKADYAEATAARTIKRAKQFWRAAMRAKLVSEDVWTGIKPGSMSNAERQVFISRADIAKVTDACPDREWRLIVALARFGGLRCPSELNALTWADVNRETNRITVRSPKTGTRIIPLFPELVEPLADCFAAAEDGETHVIAKYVRQANLRTRFRKIIERAGLIPWERLFHNLRASRQTELEDKFPSHVVCSWMGNSEAIARKHYLQVREDHFDAALQSAAKSGAVTGFTGCTENQADAETTENASLLTVCATGEMGDCLRNVKGYPQGDSKHTAKTQEIASFSRQALQKAVQSTIDHCALLALTIKTHLAGDIE